MTYFLRTKPVWNDPPLCHSNFLEALHRFIRYEILHASIDQSTKGRPLRNGPSAFDSWFFGPLGASGPCEPSIGQ